MTISFSACNSVGDLNSSCPDGICGEDNGIDQSMYIKIFKPSSFVSKIQSSETGRAEATSRSGAKIVLTGQGISVTSIGSARDGEVSEPEIVEENEDVEPGDIVVVNGVNNNDLGDNQNGEKNEETILKDKVSPIDLVDIATIDGDLTVTVPVVFQYDTAFFDKSNMTIRDAGGTDWRGFNEGDIIVYSFDKNEGHWKAYAGDVKQDTTAKTLSLDVTENGRYCYAYKESSNEELQRYYETHPDVWKMLTRGVAQPETTETGARGDIGWTDYSPIFPTDQGVSHCSSAGGAISETFDYAFEKSCLYHDWCYRYGNNTYGFPKIYCDGIFFAMSARGCHDTYKPTVPAYYKGKKCWWKVCIRYWFPNPEYAVQAARYGVMIGPCVISAGVMADAVLLAGASSYMDNDSGCYDYLKYGVNCNAVNRMDIRTYAGSYSLSTQKLVPGTSLELWIYRRSNVSTIHSVAIDHAIWTIDPNIGYFSVSGQGPGNIVLNINATTQPGSYPVTVQLYGENGSIISGGSLTTSVNVAVQ